MQRLEVSGAVRPIYGSLGVKRLNSNLVFVLRSKNGNLQESRHCTGYRTLVWILSRSSCYNLKI